jgi:hypothetical protein
MLLDALPAPIQNSLYAFIGFPVVAADELSRAGRRLSDEADAWWGRGFTQVSDWAGRIPTVPVHPPTLDDLSDAVDARVRVVEERLAELDQRVEDVLDKVESQLPDPARGAMSRTRTQLRTLVPSRN